MIVFDTSVLIAALAQQEPALLDLFQVLASDEQLALTTPVLYEWLRGPRTPGERQLQQVLLPDENAIPFGADEAAMSAHLYRTLPRTRPRAFDFAIAACALTRGAALWTLNREDFADIPGLKLVRPSVA